MKDAIKYLKKELKKETNIAQSLQKDEHWQECLDHWCNAESLAYSIKILNGRIHKE